MQINEKEKAVLLEVPIKNWSIIMDTLSMDCQSNFVDKKIRKELKQAISSVKELNRS